MHALRRRRRLPADRQPWRHYERLRDWPGGLLAVGDTFVSFNPVFGQGITVAASEALVLRDALAAGLRSPMLAG